MGTPTPKLGINKPTPDVEVDWGYRWNENADLLDDAVLVANLTATGTVTVIDDGSGNVTVSGTPHPLLATIVLDAPDDNEDATIMRTTASITLSKIRLRNRNLIRGPSRCAGKTPPSSRWSC